MEMYVNIEKTSVKALIKAFFEWKAGKFLYLFSLRHSSRADHAAEHKTTPSPTFTAHLLSSAWLKTENFIHGSNDSRNNNSIARADVPFPMMNVYLHEYGNKEENI